MSNLTGGERRTLKFIVNTSVDDAAHTIKNLSTTTDKTPLQQIERNVRILVAALDAEEKGLNRTSLKTKINAALTRLQKTKAAAN
jgi:hypothetical protein